MLTFNRAGAGGLRSGGAGGALGIRLGPSFMSDENGRAPFAGGQLLHRNLGGGVLSKNRNVVEGRGAGRKSPLLLLGPTYMARPLHKNIIMEV